MAVVRFFSAVSLVSFAAVLACSAGSEQSGDGDGDSSSAGDGDSSSAGDGDLSGGDGDGSPGDGDLTVGDGDLGGDGDGNICETVVVTTKPNPPVIMVLLDQSGSMKDVPLGGTEPRWTTLTGALGDSMTSLQSVAEFGLIGFPTHLVSSHTVASESCNAELKSAPGIDNATAAIGSINSAVPQTGHTPVRAALNLARTELANAAYAEKEKYVILITDGLPNCKGIEPSSSATSGFANYEDPSDVVTAMSGEGISTFVVGYEIEGLSQWSEGVEHFAVTYADNMAEAGGTGAHQSVSTGAELSSVLGDITKSVAPCSFELDSAPMGGASYIRVTIDDTDYALDEAWSLEGGTTVSLIEEGPACAVLRDGGEHSIRIQVECEPVVVR